MRLGLEPVKSVGVAVAATIALTTCVGSGEVQTRMHGQIVGLDEKPIGPGLVLIERGHVHNGVYRFGALIDEDGRWSADLPEGGTWGIHLFRDDYQYLPMEITIENGEQVVLQNTNVQWGAWMDLTGQPAWPDQPADKRLTLLPFDDNDADNPELSNLSMRYQETSDGTLLKIGVDVFDPNGDLARMLLAHDPTTGGGYAFNPPSPPSADGKYPNGHYTLQFYLDERHVPGESPLYFVVSDNLCNDSDILIATIPPRP